MRFTKVAMVLALLATMATAAFAQETTGSIRGRVVDPQALAVPGASVTANGPQGAKTVTSDSEGRFTIAFLTPGAYTVTAELQGFKKAENQNVNVSLGQAVDVTFKMEVGGLTDTVQVAAVARVVDTTSTVTAGLAAAKAVAVQAKASLLKAGDDLKRSAELFGKKLLSESDMAAAYMLADVVVSASTDPEAFGRVTAEVAGLEGGVSHGRARGAPFDHGEQQVGVGVTLRRMQDIVHTTHGRGHPHRADMGRSFIGPQGQFHGVLMRPTSVFDSAGARAKRPSRWLVRNLESG